MKVSKHEKDNHEKTCDTCGLHYGENFCTIHKKYGIFCKEQIAWYSKDKPNDFSPMVRLTALSVFAKDPNYSVPEVLKKLKEYENGRGKKWSEVENDTH